METLNDIARRYGIRLILQFGSSVKGHGHAGSDVDVAILSQTADRPLLEELEIAQVLQPYFPEGELDLVELRRADPLLLKQVLEGCRLIYGAPTALHELQMYGFKRYQDHKRYLEMEAHYVKRRLEERR